jgi:hypothetical protein
MSYLSTTTPDFPVISWLVTLPTIDVDVTADFGAGPLTFTRTIPAGTQLWGFNTDALGVDQPDSILGAVAAAAEDIIINDFGVAGTVTCTRLWNNTGTVNYLAGRFDYAGPAPVGNIVISFPLAGTESFVGEPSGGVITISNLTGFGFNAFNCAGYFAPYNLTVLDNRNFENTVYSAESISGNRLEVVSWGNEKEGRVLTFPFVYAAYLYDYRRALAVFSDVALTDPDDPNNLLQRLREAALSASNFEFRVFQDNAEYSTSYITQQSRLENLNDYAEDVSGAGQLFSVTIPFRTISKTGAL